MQGPPIDLKALLAASQGAPGAMPKKPAPEPKKKAPPPKMPPVTQMMQAPPSGGGYGGMFKP